MEQEDVKKMFNEMCKKNSKKITESHCFDLMYLMTRDITDDFYNIHYLADGLSADVSWFGSEYRITIKPIKEEK